ncbi:MAG: hypothetical protein E5Y10_22320 [Mesorhizobium sp.]|uniref:hypothetical protein n=1 Tax=Mesorhizobium sp. TaxID=1871066 RepID=UPI001206CA5F|nr:hypothetical protein [Mesorhizobium sp.]TIN36866.1 MAG: hypothetical protein E5Y13_22930 [Mesorhizobium sp.]TJU86711.1 MAG: hypothetical protein E5Y10_22320 [Mesorhizobium sp.]
MAVEQPKQHVDPSVRAECAGVVDVPHRFIPYHEASRLWAEDRRRSGDCKRLNHAKALTIKALTK